MRSLAVLAAFLAASSRVAGHPLCYDDTPTNLDQELTFCPPQQDGACCTDLDEANLATRLKEAGAVSSECAGYYTELICGQCHSYSGHLYGRLIEELGVVDGLSMTKNFCEELVKACTGQGKIVFPTYDGGDLDYCEKHTGAQDDDLFWSYPYTEEEIFEPGLNEAFPGVDFPAQMISVKQSPDGSVFWLMGQAGEIISVDADDFTSQEQVVDIGGLIFLELEEGLLDFAFDPNFKISGAFYLSHTVDLDDDDLGPRNRLSKFGYAPGDPAATVASQEVLLTTTDKPNRIHAAGWVDFKPSAFVSPDSSNDIYWSTGDGGPQTDPFNAGQDTTNMLGSIIRITVPSDGTGYSIPDGNLGGSALPEICANGFRNPWRCSFDRETDVLYCGDVGHTNVEEVDIVECGKNYGWSLFEGTRCQDGVEGKPDCDGLSRSGFTFPYYEYCHPDYSSVGDDVNTGGKDLCGERDLVGHAVIGGYVYHGQYFSDLLDGAYIFGDNTNNNVYYLQDGEDGITVGTIISDGSVKVIGFSQDINGELMIIDKNYNVWHMPCGDLCATTCLDQSETLPTFESVGCFTDVVEDRGLPIQSEDCEVGETAMSAEICASYCATIPGSEYMALEFASECYCGGSEVADGSAHFGRHGSSGNCYMPCSATPDETCGGPKAMEVFKLGAPATTDTSSDPVVPDPDPVDPPEPTDPAYLGCFVDEKGDRVMTKVGGTSSTAPLSAEICAVLCAGSAFYGTQFGYECWCGSADDYGRHGAGTCDVPCVGNAGEFCGGFYAISVYSNGGGGGPAGDDVDPVAEPPYLGCFADDRGDRVFEVAVIMASPSMTTAACKKACSGSAFYATQYAEECWCGAAGTDYTAKGGAVCDYECTGAASEICGGFEALSVYENNDDDDGEAVDPVDPAAPGYLGCFGDVRNARVFEVAAVLGSTSMTTALCKSECSEYALYATQWGEECWCGAADTDYAQYGEGVCDFECTGEAGEICGGYYAMSVYSN